MRNGQAAGYPVARELSWVPKAALNYLAHTEGGASIRALARKSGCHASTVSRQVRAFEARRDDMLVDEALRRLGSHVVSEDHAGSSKKETRMTALPIPNDDEPTLTKDRLSREARRVLRRLCEKGAVLAVAAEMDKAVVVRETEAGSNRTAVVDRDIAEAMALNDWITCDAPGRISRYRITTAGRTALGQLMADAENEASGFSESRAEFLGDVPEDESTDANSSRRRVRYGQAETPLTLLARRRDRDGERFLSEVLVRAGERLREDFEMAQMTARDGQIWDQYLTGEAPIAVAETASGGSKVARTRVLGALSDLGPGLGDVVLRCCCLLEGLETAEKSMGWSARSGKIVLRIALQRLKRHYDDLGDSAGLMG
ncbi:MAG: DUF6456 domain-containing protein [Pseudomonadota bacterium]